MQNSMLLPNYSTWHKYRILEKLIHREFYRVKESIYDFMVWRREIWILMKKGKAHGIL